MSFKIKLDKERELRYTYESFERLEKDCGIIVNKPATYTDFTPVRIRDLIWAGLLWEKRPMSKEDLNKIMPMDLEQLYDLATVAANAIRDALGMTKKEDAASKD